LPASVWDITPTVPLSPVHSSAAQVNNVTSTACSQGSTAGLSDARPAEDARSGNTAAFEADASATGLNDTGFTRRNVRASRIQVEAPPEWTYKQWTYKRPTLARQDRRTPRARKPVLQPAGLDTARFTVP
jgi:hypothetical protein